MRLSLRVALNADIGRADRVEPGRVDDGVGYRVEHMLAPRAVARLAADVPLGDALRPEVVVDGMAAVAERAGGPLHLIFRVVRDPPFVPRTVAAPLAVLHVPLRGVDEQVVAPLGEVALLPLLAVGERDIVRTERHEGVGRLEVAQDRVGTLARVDEDIRHERFLPPVVDLQMAVAAGGRAGEFVRIVGRVGWRRGRGAAAGSQRGREGEKGARKGPCGKAGGDHQQSV